MHFIPMYIMSRRAQVNHDERLNGRQRKCHSCNVLLGVHPTMLFLTTEVRKGAPCRLSSLTWDSATNKILCFGGNLMHENLPETKCDERASTHRVATSGELAHSANNKAPQPPSTSSRSIKAATMNSSCPPIMHNTKSRCS